MSVPETRISSSSSGRNILAALRWMDDYGDVDGDGFVEYAPHGNKGLVQQGWKDSNDSVFHADGSIAVPPIALCEVQGYVYAAKLAAAHLSSELGDEKPARTGIAGLDSAREI